MFNNGLREKVAQARAEILDRLENIGKLLSNPDLDGTLRVELEAQQRAIQLHSETRLRKINGGP